MQPPDSGASRPTALRLTARPSRVAPQPKAVAAHAIAFSEDAGHAAPADIEAASRGALVPSLRPVSFAEAVAPPPIPLPRGGQRAAAPLLVCTGDADVLQGRLELTPLRKGMGLSGAGWFHRPVAVMAGFETSFTFTVTPPPPVPNADPAGPPPRASDGFAFVLQLDPRRSSAVGGAGVQMGHGGLSASLAVQFSVSPSCATSKRRPAESPNDPESEEAENQTLCTLPEPYDHIFFVPNHLSEKECICPFTGFTFLAPALAAPTDEEDVEFAEVDLSHRRDRVSVHCAGAGVNSSGPETCISAAPLRPIDDGEPHTARIVLEQNRFHDGAAPTVEESQPSASHRLTVYLDELKCVLATIVAGLPVPLDAPGALCPHGPGLAW